MDHRFLVTVLTTLVLITTKSTVGYPTGAPPSQCKTLLPSHGSSAQQIPTPYVVSVDKTNVAPGETVHVTLTSASGDTPFAGFIAVARKYSMYGGYGDVHEVYGRFAIPVTTAAASDGSRPLIKSLACFDIPNTGLTHSNGGPKSTIEFDWIAPNENGSYVIVATFVKDFDTFWARIPSEKIRVKKA